MLLARVREVPYVASSVCKCSIGQSPEGTVRKSPKARPGNRAARRLWRCQRAAGPDSRRGGSTAGKTPVSRLILRQFFAPVRESALQVQTEQQHYTNKEDVRGEGSPAVELLLPRRSRAKRSNLRFTAAKACAVAQLIRSRHFHLTPSPVCFERTSPGTSFMMYYQYL